MPMNNEQNPLNTTHQLKQRGTELGFHHIGIAQAVSPPGFHPLLEWLGNGYSAGMDWIERRRDAYHHPDGVLPGTRSVIVAASQLPMWKPFAHAASYGL